MKEELGYKFSWKTLFAAPENKQIHKILKASVIVFKRPSLKKQIESKKLLLFRNSATWEFYNFLLYLCIYWNFNHHFNFCVSKSLYYSTALLQKAFTDILNYDIHFTYIIVIHLNFISYHSNVNIILLPLSRVYNYLHNVTRSCWSEELEV